MYRRYYRYNDPVPGQKRPAPPPPPPAPKPEKPNLPFDLERLFSGMERDDLVLVGLILLLLLGEDKDAPDWPLLLALVYLLLRK